MQSKAATVAQYLKELPPDRRKTIEAVRAVILKNLDKNLVEQMQYGMIGYCVPHSVFPDGYHCDPKQPLPYAGLAAQKNSYSLYLGAIYGDEELTQKLVDAFKRIGKKPKMGKVCINFNSVEDLPLEDIGKIIKSFPARKFIARYVEGRDAMKSAKSQSKKTSKKSAKRN
jgi:uncharacterized protein YdhG (YjbR/CyaY superfamily)